MLEKFIKNFTWSDKKGEYMSSSEIIDINGSKYCIEEPRKAINFIIRKTITIGDALFNGRYRVFEKRSEMYSRKMKKAGSLESKGIATFSPIGWETPGIGHYIKRLESGDVWITKHIEGITRVSAFLGSYASEENKYTLIKNIGSLLGEIHNKEETIDDPSCINIAVSPLEISKLYVGPFDLKPNPEMYPVEKRARELVMLATNTVHWAKGLDAKKARKEFFDGYFENVEISIMRFYPTEEVGIFWHSSTGEKRRPAEYIAALFRPLSFILYQNLVIGGRASINKTKEELTAYIDSKNETGNVKREAIKMK